jgi:hypothetical protein
MMNRFVQTSNCDATVLDGEWIILNTNQYTITKLNDIGGHCWSLLSEIQTADTITQSILDKFPGTEGEQQVKNDIEEFLENLLRCGLIQDVD